MRLAVRGELGRRVDGNGWWRRLALQMRIRAKDRRFARELERIRLAQPTIRERQQELVRFYMNYENLVEVLCDLSTCGPTPNLETAYKAIREWMQKNYPDVRRYVIAYLKYSAEDAQQSLDINGKSADAFEALFTAPTLREFMEHDDGKMIGRINRTREALTMYGHHLRLLASND
ncbi:MAG TPA: hypothetical protein VHE55_12335 [Fimbriimonadaceae bacterium]|nr:hypothetical protein [Fimbriimonadaceae bacterium]